MNTVIYWLARAFIAGVQALPLKFVALLGRFFGAVAALVDKPHRQVALDNLRLCFAAEKSEPELRALAAENFRRLGENYLCGIKTAGFSYEQVLACCEVVGFENLCTAAESAFIGPHEAFTEQGTPGAAPSNRIVAIGHFGNFELYATLARCLPGYQGATTYRGLPHPVLDRLLRDLRELSGCLFFERRSDGAKLKAALNRKGLLLGVLADQHTGQSGVWIPFFGHDCATTTAPAVFALRYDSPLNTAICYRTGLGRWRVEIGGVIPTRVNGRARKSEEIMRDVNISFEAAVRRDPANWFWVHKRWKPEVRP